MKIEAVCIVDEGGFRLVNRKAFQGEVNSLPRGKYRMTVKKLYKEKSNSQLGYYYACVLPIFFTASLNEGWEFASLEELDYYLKSQFANKDLINKHTGEVISIPSLKREMTTLEFTTFIEQVRDHAAEFLHTYIPEPSEQILLPL